MGGRKKDEHDNQKGLPKFVRDRRNKDDRAINRIVKNEKTSGKATNKDGKGKR